MEAEAKLKWMEELHARVVGIKTGLFLIPVHTEKYRAAFRSGEMESFEEEREVLLSLMTDLLSYLQLSPREIFHRTRGRYCKTHNGIWSKETTKLLDLLEQHTDTRIFGVLEIADEVLDQVKEEWDDLFLRILIAFKRWCTVVGELALPMACHKRIENGGG